MNRWVKNALVILGMTLGPFVTVGITVYYRRALEFWYIHGVEMAHDMAEVMSVIVMFILAATIGFTFLLRSQNDSKQFWWE